jgi:hypothetical protein
MQVFFDDSSPGLLVFFMGKPILIKYQTIKAEHEIMVLF